MTARVTKALACVLRNGLANTLVEDGYRQTGPRDFHLAREDHTRVVGVVLNKFWGHDDTGRFTVKLGVYFPAVAQACKRPAPDGLPALGDCYPLGVGLGYLIPEAVTETGEARQEIQWVIGRETDLDRLAKELSGAWQDYGRPWIECCSDLAGARDWLGANACLWDASVISVMLGERDQARTFLARLLEHQPYSREKAIPWAVDQRFLDAEAVPQLRHALMQDVTRQREGIREALWPRK